MSVTPVDTLDVRRIVAFTGSRKGPTQGQRNSIRRFIESFAREDRDSIIIHGGAVGVDSAVHGIAMKAGLWVEIYPGPHTSVDILETPAIIHKRAPYLERNHTMVDRCNWVIAVPYEAEEQVRSGTWATVRYARKQDVPVYMIWPDGSIELDDTFV